MFLVDTSLSSNPDRFNIWLKLLRTTLDANRDSLKKFNVLFFSVDAHAFKPALIDNTPENVDALLTYANGLALEGATDLGAAFGELARISQSPTDVFLLSDGAATWGESNQHALAKMLRASKSTLFAYQTGLAGTDVGVLSHLARESGGAVFAVTGEAEVAKAATAHRARPWMLVSASLAGATDVMLAGRPTALFPGQTITAVGRGTVGASSELVLEVEQGGRRQTVRTKLAPALATPLASRVYGQVATARLEELEDATVNVARAYATHFRVTGRSSSLLMLESEADYQRFHIKPDADAFTIKATPAAALFDGQLTKLFDTPRRSEGGVPRASRQAREASERTAPAIDVVPHAALADAGVGVRRPQRPAGHQAARQEADLAGLADDAGEARPRLRHGLGRCADAQELVAVRFAQVAVVARRAEPG